MKDPRIKTSMPELVVYFKALILGFVASEVGRCAYQIGQPLANKLHTFHDAWSVCLQLLFVILVFAYAFSRDIGGTGRRLFTSKRVDLLITLGIGAACDWFLIDSKAVNYLKQLDSQELGWGWAAALLLFFALLMVTAWVSALQLERRRPDPQFYFMTDKEIDGPTRDCLSQTEDASTFAKTVLASNTESGLVFGIEGPWGVGKTSFLKIAQDYWATQAQESIIVFRFEPLRYAGEPDLTERFIKEMLTVVQSKVFAPEFKVALSRYSKMLKGKAEFSLFGLKMSFEPTNETIDQLLTDVDSVLRRTHHRLIVIVEDLDRIEPKAVSNVLFTVRRTFALSQATYVLCYDTENLIAGKDDGAVSREFLEKFINVKFSLLLDSASIIEYLRTGWQNEEKFVQALTSDREPVLKELLADLAELLAGQQAVEYMRLVGNLRKIKRFINAVISMQLEKLDISITDFNRGDIINLVLLHMNYPGVFRSVYAEETEGRSGMFSTVDSEGANSGSMPRFSAFIKNQEPGAQFLLNSLFSTQVRASEKGGRTTRAFSNKSEGRYLESYLTLIIRRVVPDPAETLKLYQDAVSEALNGGSIEEILSRRGFELCKGERAHQQFWNILVGHCNDRMELASSVIEAILNMLPGYMSLRVSGDSLRHRLILDIHKLLAVIIWEIGREKKPQAALYVAHYIFGEGKYEGRGIVERMLKPERDVFKWRDVLLLRLNCSRRKSSRYPEVYDSLYEYQAQHDGSNEDTEGLRVFSQYVFARFKSEFIEPGKNLFEQVAQVPIQGFLVGVRAADASAVLDESTLSLEDQVATEKNSFLLFVVENMLHMPSSRKKEHGCGFYDEAGVADKHQISSLISRYLFEVCFNVDKNEGNLLHFVDFCMANFLQESTGVEKPDAANSEFDSALSASSVILSLDLPGLTSYWMQHRNTVLSAAYMELERRVCTPDFIRSYKDDLQAVCDALDAFCEATTWLPHEPLVT